MEKRVKRNLDGIYFIIDHEPICFSDMTEEEQDNILNEKSDEWLRSVCKILAKTIREIGDKFDLVSGSDISTL